MAVSSLDRNNRYFDIHILWQTCYLYSFPCRWFLCKKAAVNLIHRSEIVHITQKYAGFHHMLEPKACGPQNMADILHDHAGLSLDIPGLCKFRGDLS